MPVNQVSGNSTFGWQLTNGTVTNFVQPVQGADSVAFSLSGVSTTTFNQLFAAYFSLAASGGTVTYDLTSFTNLVYESVTLGHALTFVVSNLTATSTGTILNVAPGASNGLQWFFGGSTQSINVADSAFFMYSLPYNATGQVVNSTHKTITLTNNGTGTCLGKILIYGSTT